jgi:hypothetical protein
MKRLLVLLLAVGLVGGVYAQGGLEQGEVGGKTPVEPRTFQEAYDAELSARSRLWGNDAQEYLDAISTLEQEFPDRTEAEQLLLDEAKFYGIYRLNVKAKDYTSIINEGRIFIAKYPEISDRTANMLNYFAYVLFRNGELAEAESIWRSVLDADVGVVSKFLTSWSAFWSLNKYKMLTPAEKNGYLVELIRELAPKRIITDESDLVWKALNELNIPALGKDLDEARAKYRELLDYINLVVPATEENKAFIGFVESERDLKK